MSSEKDQTQKDFFNQVAEGTLPDHLGITITDVTDTSITAEFEVRSHHMAPNGFLHAGSLVTLADTACGMGAMHTLPEGANGFTTIELKSNHLATAREGCVECTATLFHGGRTTQVWDAEVKNKHTGKTMVLFRCTQMILYPK